MELSITEIASAIQEKSLDPVDLFEELLERISRFDREIRSYVRLNPDSVQEARALGPNARGVAFGIPFSIKDLIDTKQIVTAFGSKALLHRVPRADAKVVKTIKAQGGIVLGKTNTHQFALGLETPPTKNPWDTTRIPGGSSGGSAAAVAADLALAAVGTDTGGSIRIPAAMCGVTGMKPTFGRISTKGVFPSAPSFDHVGPLCRFASDLPLLLDAMGYQIKFSSIKFPIKVGIVADFLRHAQKNVRATVKKCFNLLASERLVEIDEIELPMFEEACEITETIDTFETARIHRKRYLASPRQFQKTARGLIQAGLLIKRTDLQNAKSGWVRARQKFAELMKKYPIIMFPTLPRIAPRPEEIKGYASSDFLPMVRPLEIFDLLGYPAISIPCGFASGLPVGAHFASFSDLDYLVIELARSYQNVTDWHTKVNIRYQGFLSRIRNNS